MFCFENTMFKCSSATYMKHYSCIKPYNGIPFFHSSLFVSLMILFSAQVMADTAEMIKIFKAITDLYVKGDPQLQGPNAVANLTKKILEQPDIQAWLERKGIEIASSGRNVNDCTKEIQKEFVNYILAKKAAKDQADAQKTASQNQYSNSDRGMYTMGGQSPTYTNMYQNPSNTYGSSPGASYYNQPHPGFTSNQYPNTKEGYQQERQHAYTYESITPGYGAPYTGQSGYQRERYDSQPTQPYQPHPGQNLGQDNIAARIHSYFGSRMNYGQQQTNQYPNDMGQAHYTGGTQGMGQTQGHYGTGQNQYSSAQGNGYYGQYSAAGQNQNTYSPHMYRTGENQQGQYNSFQYQNPNYASGYGQANYQGQYQNTAYRDQYEITSTTNKPKNLFDDIFNFVNKKIL